MPHIKCKIPLHRQSETRSFCPVVTRRGVTMCSRNGQIFDSQSHLRSKMEVFPVPVFHTWKSPLKTALYTTNRGKQCSFQSLLHPFIALVSHEHDGYGYDLENETCDLLISKYDEICDMIRLEIRTHIDFHLIMTINDPDLHTTQGLTDSEFHPRVFVTSAVETGWKWTGRIHPSGCKYFCSSTASSKAW